MIKRSFFRKVGFGIGPDQSVPEDPLSWAQSQMDTVPPLSWKGDIPTGEKLMDYYATWVYQDRKVLREKYRTDRKAYRAAKNKLRLQTGERFFENLELSIRHDAAIHSGAPVFERLWWFWCNHFAITDKDFMPEFTTGAYHRETIRKNMTGSFEALATAATISWSMINNLDNSQSIGPNSKSGRWRKQNGKPATVNENHARELLELHLLSPAADYTQKDVVSMSYIMAGWELGHSKKRLECNPVKFNQDKHQPGDHLVLGKRYKQRGLTPKNRLLDAIKDLVVHPACSEFLAHKLCRHFITDDPTPEMTQPVIDAWRNSNGDLPTVHKALLAVAYEYADKTQKFQSPEVWMIQMVNMTGAQWPPKHRAMNYNFESEPSKFQRLPEKFLREIGHNPFRPTQPNGWPDTFEEWVSPELIIRRLAVAQIFANPPYAPSKFNKRKFDAVHLINSNFDDLEPVLAYLGQTEDKLSEIPAYMLIEPLFPSKWMLFS